MPKKVTIQDISQLAGTSPSTVSRVLTGSATVSPEKRQAIEQAIQQLNYRPSQLARSLKTSITYSIGLLVNDIANPFYSAIVRGAEEEALRQGYSLILCNTNEDPQREFNYLQLLQDKQVDGIIMGPTGHHLEYLANIAQQTPLVQIDRRVDRDDIAAVVVDNENGAYQATRLLIEKGHERIAVMRWNKDITTMTDRYAGYERAMREANLPIEPSLILEIDSLSTRDAARLATEMLSQDWHATAILALNNQLGLGALIAIRQLHLRIPQDIALITFDDMDLFELTQPPITTVDQPAFMIGEQAMRLLIRQIQEGERFVPEVIVFPTHLIVRESV